MASKDKEAALPEGQAEKPKKKSKAKKIGIILALILVLLAIGMGAYWWFFMRAPAPGVPEETAVKESGAEVPAQGHAPAEPAADGNVPATAKIERPGDLPRSTGMVLPLPPITVNLSDPGGRRYLKLGMEVEVNQDVSAELKASGARIRDAIIMLLAGKSYGDIATPDGKVLLKAEIAARLNQILGAQRVVRVYLTDFMVE